MAAVLIVLLGVAVSATGCKHRVRYDRRSLEATLASFQKAVNRGRIPRDLREFVSNPHELAIPAAPPGDQPQ